MRSVVPALTLLLALGLAACGAGPDFGLTGVVLAGPTCPVQRVGRPCPDRPVSVRLRAGTATFTSDAQGRFRVSLPPGTYTIVNAGRQPFPRCRATATVPPHAFVSITITCDTGIRSCGARGNHDARRPPRGYGRRGPGGPVPAAGWRLS
jgi:hypothetical protein